MRFLLAHNLASAYGFKEVSWYFRATVSLAVELFAMRLNYMRKSTTSFAAFALFEPDDFAWFYKVLSLL